VMEAVLRHQGHCRLQCRGGRDGDGLWQSGRRRDAVAAGLGNAVAARAGPYCLQVDVELA
jgi:hypothetical protein